MTHAIYPLNYDDLEAFERDTPQMHSKQYLDQPGATFEWPDLPALDPKEAQRLRQWALFGRSPMGADLTPAECALFFECTDA